jgi:hypothetical protein
LGGNKRPQKVALRSHYANFIVSDLDALGQRAQVIPPIAAPFDPDLGAGGSSKCADHGGAARLMGRAFQHGLSALGVYLRLITLRLAMRSLSAGSSRSATPASMASVDPLQP